jgi:crossover junction endodeoxyribonuclease RusA
MREYAFFVAGVPVTKGSKTMVRLKSGKYMMVEAGNMKKRDTLKVWMRTVKETAIREVPEVLGGAVSLDVTFYLHRGKTIKRSVPCVKPDLDKLMRGVGDALSGVAYEDDARITDITMRKRYAGEDGTGAYIIVREYYEEEPS